jgi:predicted MFS family arabinose efflux permease
MSIATLWRTGGPVLLIGFLTLFIGGGGRHGIGLVLKPMADDLSWDRGLLGAVIAVFMVMTACAMIAVGRLADRFPPAWILGGGFLISAAGIGLMGLATAPWQAFLLYGVIFALGNGAVSITPVGVMITRRFGQRAGLANAVAISGMGLGQLAILSGLSFVLEAGSWREVFSWLGAINLAAVPLVVLALMREAAGRPAPARDAEGMTIKEAARTRGFWLLMALYALCGIQDFFVSVHVVAFALDEGVASLFAGNLLAFMGLAGLIGVLLAGAWSDLVGPAWPTAACFVLRLVIFGVITVLKDPALIAAFALLFGLTYWVTAPLTVIFVRNLFGARNLGGLSGLVTSTHHIAGGLGAWAGAALFDVEGDYQMAFIAMIVISLAGALLSLKLR